MSAALQELSGGSTPGLSEFDPTKIPYQFKVITDIRQEFDYELGTHECLLSGAYGSSKSLTAAHIAITHCLMHKKARFLIGRRGLPDLKRTIYQKIVEHLSDQSARLYRLTDSIARVEFANGSEIIAGSWADKKFRKFRSLELSGAAIEELTENDEDDKKAIDEIRNRVGRLSHVRERIMLYMTNPDSPSHWAYKYFFVQKNAARHIYYSISDDNPFLDKAYLAQMKRDMDPKLQRRMLYGEWIELATEGIYYQYTRQRNFRDVEYKVSPMHPIHWSWDFNIGVGKPLSCIFYQVIGDTFHVFAEIIVEGARTENAMEEARDRGLLSHPAAYYIHGDATGKARSTAAKHSNYEVISNFLRDYRRPDKSAVRFEVQVPSSNPPIRERHNIVNAYCLNVPGEVRLFVYKNCATVDEGMRLTQLKKGAEYIEDDSKWYQHVTTALGYAICYNYFSNSSQSPRMYPR